MSLIPGEAISFFVYTYCLNSVQMFIQYKELSTQKYFYTNLCNTKIFWTTVHAMNGFQLWVNERAPSEVSSLHRHHIAGHKRSSQASYPDTIICMASFWIKCRLKKIISYVILYKSLINSCISGEPCTPVSYSLTISTWLHMYAHTHTHGNHLLLDQFDCMRSRTNTTQPPVAFLL